MTAPGTAKGTWNTSIPASSTCGQGSVTSKVDCLSVAGNTGDTTERITQPSGIFDGLKGQELTVEGVDSTPDELTQDGGFFTSGPCDFSYASIVTPILHGNVNVRD